MNVIEIEKYTLVLFVFFFLASDYWFVFFRLPTEFSHKPLDVFNFYNKYHSDSNNQMH